MTQTGVAGPLSFANPDHHRDYIQRVAEEQGMAVVKVDGTFVNTRGAINLASGTGISLVGTDDPTANEVKVTITNAASALTDPVTAAHGGTGRTTLTSNALLVGNGTSSVTMLTVGSTNQILSVVAGAPAWTTIDGGSA